MAKQNLLAVFTAVFSLCWVVFLALPRVDPACPLGRLADVFPSACGNFIFLTILFLFMAYSGTLLIDWLVRFSKRFRPFRPRLGEFLLNSGYISQEELFKALELQRLGLGDILVEAGHIAPGQLRQAREYQKKASDRGLGQILVELGVATEAQVSWAKDRCNRKLGKILLEMGVVCEEDLHRTLGRLWHGRRGFRSLFLEQKPAHGTLRMQRSDPPQNRSGWRT